MQPVESSAIDAVGYDGASQVLEVRFISGGTYRYRDVPPAVASGLLAAESKGCFLHAAILDRYAFERIA